MDDQEIERRKFTFNHFAMLVAQLTEIITAWAPTGALVNGILQKRYHCVNRRKKSYLLYDVGD